MGRWVVVFLVGCGTTVDGGTDGTDPTGGGDGCAALCTGGGYDGGTEFDYGEVVECVCDGAGPGLTQEACTGYCADLGVGASGAFLSTNANPNDKCVCDGYSG